MSSEHSDVHGFVHINEFFLTSHRPLHEDRQEILHGTRPILTRRIRSLSLPTKDVIDLPTLQDTIGNVLMPSTNLPCSTPDTDNFSEISYEPRMSHSPSIPCRKRSSGSSSINVSINASHTFATDLSDEPVANNSSSIKRSVSPNRVHGSMHHGHIIVDDSEFETDRDTADLDDDDMDIGTANYEDLLEEAYNRYGNEKPEFCVRDVKETTRTVQLIRSEKVTNLLFKNWLGGKYGYWLLTTSTHDHYIVKYMNGHYHVWCGIDTQFSANPITSPLNNNKRQLQDDVTHENTEAQSEPRRGLRARSLKQEKPYQVYKARKRSEDKGIQITDLDLEEELNLAESSIPPTQTRVKRIPKRVKGNKLDSNSLINSSAMPANGSTRSVSMPMSIHSSTSAASSNSTLNSENIVLRTRIGDFSGPSIAVYLKDIPSSADLFHRLRQKWAFKLANQQLSYCIARFEWLGSDKSILIQESDDDGFRLMYEEARRTPAGRSGDQVDIEIDIYTI